MVGGAKIYVEGGSDSDKTRSVCRQGFSKLLRSLGFEGRMPKIIACGGRRETFEDFVNACNQSTEAFIALLVDSEDPMTDIEQPWNHLRQRQGDEWIPPAGVTDDQAQLMVTCMETWLIADRIAIRRVCGSGLIERHLPFFDLENRTRKKQVFDKLVAATKNCDKRYSKGDISFAILAEVDP